MQNPETGITDSDLLNRLIQRERIQALGEMCAGRHIAEHPDFYAHPERKCTCMGDDEPAPPLYCNIDRHHFAYCKTHKRYLAYGDNLFSGWADESPYEWMENAAKLATYTPKQASDADVLCHALVKAQMQYRNRFGQDAARLPYGSPTA